MLGTALRVAAVLAGTAATSLAQQREDLVLVLRSLLPLMPPELQVDAPRASAFEAMPDLDLALDTRGERNLPDWVIGVLRERHLAAINDGTLRVELAAGGDSPGPFDQRIVFQGKRDKVQAAVAEFDAMGKMLGRPIEVRALHLPLPAGALPATVWDPATTGKRLQDATPLWSARGVTRSGGTLRLADLEARGALGDYSVEVAERARIADPHVLQVFAGLAASLSVHTLTGDDLQLSGSWLASRPNALHQQSTEVDGITLDQPEHRTTYASFSGAILSGGALAVAFRGGAFGPDGGLLVVTARYLAPPASDPAPDFLLRPVTAFLAAPSPPLPHRLAWPIGSDDDGPPFRRMERDGGFTESALLGLLPTQLGDVELSGGVLLARGDAPVTLGCNRLLAQLAAEVRTIEWHSSVVDDTEPASTIELVQPTLAGRTAAAFLGTERPLIRDFQVEIASRSSIAAPMVSIARSGLWFLANVDQVGDGWHVAGTWSVATHGAPRLRRFAEERPLDVQLTDYRTTTLPWDAAMPAGHAHELGQAPPLRPDGKPSRVRVSLTPRP